MPASTTELRTSEVGDVSRVLRRVAIVVAVLALQASGAAAQVVLGAGYGSGWGTETYNVGQAQARVGVPGPMFAIAELESIGGGTACPADSLNELRCGYFGSSLSLGAGVNLISYGPFHLASHASVGRFKRIADGEYGGDVNATGSFGIIGEARVSSVFRLQALVKHRRIFDGVYNERLSEYPHFTAATLGLGITVR